MIKKGKGGYMVTSEDGKKNLGGPYENMEAAQRRLKQVEWFKSHPDAENQSWFKEGSGEKVEEKEPKKKPKRRPRRQ